MQLHAFRCKRNTRLQTPFRLMVSLHLSSPPCREVVCSLGVPPPPPSHPPPISPSQPMPHPNPSLPPSSPKHLQRAMARRHLLPARNAPSLADYQPASGTWAASMAGESKLTGIVNLGVVTKERPANLHVANTVFAWRVCLLKVELHWF